MDGSATTWTWDASEGPFRGRSGARSRLARLAQRARDGDRRAFTALWFRHERAARAILLSMVPAQEADDLVQDVATRAWEHIADLHEPAAFGAWLSEIARNVGRRARARRRKVRTTPLELAPEPPAAPSAEVGAEADEILAAIRKLPECYAETLLLRLVLGMSGPEIAAQLGMTSGSVRVNLCRGMKRLRGLLGDEHRE